jgi:hypothetical protein
MKGGKISQQESVFPSDYSKHNLARTRIFLFTLTHATAWHCFDKLQGRKAACFNFTTFNVSERVSGNPSSTDCMEQNSS